MTNNTTPPAQAPSPQSAAHDQRDWLLIFSCWLLATTATLGSLFMSEVMGIQPCLLCWYQRIFMYPLVFIFLVGLVPLDRKVARYALPLVTIGWLFGIYHQLLYSGYIPKDLQPCGQGVSCAEVNLSLFGFIDIPLLSVLTYTMLLGLLLTLQFRNKQANLETN